MKKQEPVLIAQSIVAACSFIFGGLTTMAATNHNATMATIGGIGTLITGGIALGLGYFVRGVVTPVSDVAAYVDNTGTTVAGPAAPQSNGTEVTTVSATSDLDQDSKGA